MKLSPADTESRLQASPTDPKPRPGRAKECARRDSSVAVLAAASALKFRIWGLGFRVWGLGFRV